MLTKLERDGFTCVESIFTTAQISKILEFLDKNEVNQEFGIRNFIPQYPELKGLIFTTKLIELVSHFSKDYYVIKSIYFDKPPNTNWIVNWHQDLTINVANKIEHEDFVNWRVVKDRTVVQPPVYMLDQILTIRIHLDDCTAQNGALRVIPGSHKEGVIPIHQNPDFSSGDYHLCEVNKGGVLIMRPLILHASRRTENLKNRRVIHIELTDTALPEGLEWNEAFHFN